jgi:cation transport protein ChaC
MIPGDGLWLFGYGSLMWKPGFAYEEARRARLNGFRRCFCIYSTHHRGDNKRPGMVLGLDRGGACDGIAYRIGPAMARATLAYLRAREQINGVYREATVTITLAGPGAGDGGRREVAAMAFIAERSHPSYAGRLGLRAQADLIRGARGISGANLDYLINTVSHLVELGIRERELERLLCLIGGYFERRAACPLTGRRSGSMTLLAATRPLPVPVRRMRPGERRRFTHRRQIAAWESEEMDV